MKVIATYHSIDASGSPVSVSPAAFRRHVAWLRSSRVRVTSVEELLAADDSERDVVALTFDDAYASIAVEAAPILFDSGLPATVFVVSRRVGGLSTWHSPLEARGPELPLLGWDDLGNLAERGFSIGSHSRTHPHLPSLEPARLDEEIGGAAEDLKDHLGLVARGFAYPFGDVSDDAAHAVGRVHEWACTTMFGELDGQDPLHLPRIDMWYFAQPHLSTLLESWGTPGFRRWVRRRRQLRRVRRAIRRVDGSV